MSKNQKLIPYIHTDNQTWDRYFVDVKSRMIYFEAKINGKRIKFSTKEKFPNGVKAKRYANSELDRRTGKKTSHVKTLISEELKSWLLFKESEGHKYDTLNNIRRAERQIKEYWGDKLPNEITRDSFAEWCAWWKSKHPSIQMENAVKYFNNFCRYLHEKVVNQSPLLPSLLYFKDPNRHLVKAKRAKKKERIFTQDEFAKIYATAANDSEACVVLFMYTMATRIDETLNLNFTDRVFLNKQNPIYRWTVGNNKAGLVGEHYLHQSLINPLKKISERRKLEKTHLVFPQKLDNLKPMREQMIDWESWRKRANLGWHWTPHTFRHTCLSYLFANPHNPHAIICKLYRVSIQVALATYVKVTPESMLAIRDSLEVKLK